MVIPTRLTQISQIRIFFRSFLIPAAPFSTHLHQSSEPGGEIERITKIINDHPFPDQPLRPTLIHHIPSPLPSNTFLNDVLGRLFAAHSNGLKALEFFKFCLHHSQASPTPDAFEKTLHILARMRYFDQSWELMREIQRTHPFLLTLKSMSILLTKIAKFQSFEETIEAFRRMENEVFVGRKFGTEEFNVLLRAFCTQRQMKEARSVFLKMYSRFPPNTKTMNLLLLGFKESSNVTAVELFYHEMIRRGFKPDAVTYSIRMDAYCKRGCFVDGLRVFEEMKRAKFEPTLETITTLIHGAGVAKDIAKARQLFDEMPLRKLCPDIGAYNALISSLIRSDDVSSAAALMEDMEAKHIGHDSMTYHMMFVGLMKLEDVHGFYELYSKMIQRNFVPKTRTVVMIMKFFCENRRVDLGLDLWGYLVEKGYCPHSHVLDVLVTGLCARGMVHEAFDCSKQMLERGRQMSDAAFLIMERSLLQADAKDILGELEQLRKKLKTVLPPPKQLPYEIPASS
ncbi:pentatricopeptide repeat-containing protein At3g61360 [Cucurbita pepo subsp. pepo]|uniref:pentatricopeptide repeat-containing protein At3g61360 n=1 Tax=Cucurbita pepo subsp. pepo TaxID=3664 RepID=UPI000C9D75AE|nr:pentatricopeptide repeat-containing protein At3g61360 [Cucurbita pepo subsp. pepo]XP_023551582.1 pentatricopeptide repeat-containing protein At3g61360 [Cucurbita pepo subsp. pepo]XP_023551583.1 pentatricopeptide repeat-containing protein At3g61360 [Cucurbita pepo subsp. pepo]XP_023551584.1 pentatricopeptide repeat-containing protein At3g61360 [Cucurbita pepo subsp. pepo]XP_023551586.1 pentatricopeptide repeat-containing protein At3g61360 [Cucurbita pepo subsp. pepo]XP_023551587.1 pentatrico